jgi:hypothetical protein
MSMGFVALYYHLGYLQLDLPYTALAGEYCLSMGCVALSCHLGRLKMAAPLA